MICRSNMIPFGNGDYHKGLFIDGRLSVDFERELDKVTFGKCEIFPCDADLPCPYEDSSAQIFLHGSCDLFAKQLREKFNYDIYEIDLLFLRQVIDRVGLLQESAALVFLV